MSKSKPKRRETKSRRRESSVTEQVFDKRPMRMPRRPEAARYESGRRTGAKKRLGR